MQELNNKKHVKNIEGILCQFSWLFKLQNVIQVDIVLIINYMPLSLTII
jgi:hypothetical protein